MNLIAHSLTAVHHVFGIRSLIGVGKLVGPLAHSVLYPRYTNTTLPLKAFRREPDISEFPCNVRATRWLIMQKARRHPT